MDATLLDGHSQLPPDFLHLVQELAGQDILFAAASGRPLYKLEEMFAPVLEQTLLVADNGGAVRWRGKDLFVSRMEPEVSSYRGANSVSLNTTRWSLFQNPKLSPWIRAKYPAFWICSSNSAPSFPLSTSLSAKVTPLPRE